MRKTHHPRSLAPSRFRSFLVWPLFGVAVVAVACDDRPIGAGGPELGNVPPVVVDGGGPLVDASPVGFTDLVRPGAPDLGTRPPPPPPPPPPRTGNDPSTIASFDRTVYPVYGNSLAAADLNGDGYLDLISTDGSSPRFTVLLGQPGGTFGAPTTMEGGKPGQGLSLRHCEIV